MVKLKDFRENKIPINWYTILVGWGGFGIPRQLFLDEIVEYAIQELAQTDNPSTELALLAGLLTHEEPKVGNLVRTLAEKEGEIDEELEVRKWHYLLLKEVLKNLSSNTFDGLSELASFWSQFDYPGDIPFYSEGEATTISISDYYKEETLKKIVKQYYDRLEEEYVIITSSR